MKDIREKYILNIKKPSVEETTEGFLSRVLGQIVGRTSGERRRGQTRSVQLITTRDDLVLANDDFCGGTVDVRYLAQ